MLAAAATTWIFRIINAVSGIITLPLILFYLNKNEYGLWVLIGQVSRFLGMSDLGIANAISRFVARFRGQNDKDSIDVVISTVLVLTVALGILVALLTFAIAPWIPAILGIGEDYASVSKTVFIITGLSLALMFPTRIGMGILTGYQYYGPHGVGKIVKSLLFLLAIVILAWMKQLNVISLAFASGITVLIGQILLFYVAWRMTGPWKILPSNCSLKMAKEMLSLGSSTILVTLSKLFYNQGMGIALGRIAGLGSVAIYGVASTIVMDIEPIIGAIGSAMPTLASEFQARGEMEKLKRIINLSILVTFALTLSAMAGLFVYAEPILRFFLKKGSWSDADLSQIGYVILIMFVGVAFWLPQLVSRSTLQAVGRHWAVTYAVLGSSIVALGIAIFAMLNGWGVYGAALGFGMELLFQGIILFPPMICKFLGESLREMFVKAYLPGFLTGIAVFAVALFLSWILPPDSVVNLILGILATFIFGIAILVPISGQTAFVIKTLKRYQARVI